MREARAAGHNIVTVPGACAAVAALTLAGLPTDRFFFEGFLPQKSGARRNRLAALGQIPGTLVLFESPHRLPEMLVNAAAILGGSRPAAVARELTKLYETIRRGTLATLAETFTEEGAPKGEVVVVIGTNPEEPPEEEVEAGLDAAIEAALSRHSIKDAAALVADATGQPRRVVYARALVLARRTDADV